MVNMEHKQYNWLALYYCYECMAFLRYTFLLEKAIVLWILWLDKFRWSNIRKLGNGEKKKKREDKKEREKIERKEKGRKVRKEDNCFISNIESKPK